MDWIEQLARIRSERRLGDIQWEISPRRPLEAEFAPGSGGELEFMASTLRVQLGLLHEEDLLRFIADLRQGLSAYVRVRQCTLERRSRASTTQAWPMQAECHLDLITVTRRDASAPKKP